MAVARSSTVTLFVQLVKRVPERIIAGAVAKRQTDYRSKGVRHADAFFSLLFHQMSGSTSLRDTVLGMESCRDNGYEQHSGFQIVKRSTLAYVNEHRSYKVYEDIYHALYGLYAPMLGGRLSSKKFGKPVYSVDSTTITLCLSAYKWAHYSHSKGAIKLHTMLNNDSLLPEVIVATDGKVADITAARELMKFPAGSIIVMDRGYNDYKLFANLTNDNVVFVTRLKDNAVHTNMAKGVRAVDADGKWGDYQVQFTAKNALATGRVEYRVVQWYDEDSQRWFEFLTNDQDLEPEEIALLYRDRWQIELFFKKVKQNLKIKDFLGTSYNAVMSQVWCAAIAILLLEVLRLQSEYSWSFSNLVHNLRLNLLSFRLIEDWLNTPDEAVTPVSIPAQQELFSTG